VLRIELEPGDAVKRGDLVARLQPETPPLLDVRARAALAQAERERERSRRLVAGGAMPAQQADVREDDARLAGEAVNAAAFSVAAATAELGRTRARLAPPSAAGGGAVVVSAPAYVVKRFLSLFSGQHKNFKVIHHCFLSAEITEINRP
jgi:multidrug efflux pump subunit AcrA (membrane-fusion protein)